MAELWNVHKKVKEEGYVQVSGIPSLTRAKYSLSIRICR